MNEDDVTMSEDSGMLSQVPVHTGGYSVPNIFAHQNMGHTVVDINLNVIARTYISFAEDIVENRITYPIFIEATESQIATLLSMGFLIQAVDNWAPVDFNRTRLYKVTGRIDSATHPDPDSLIIPDTISIQDISSYTTNATPSPHRRVSIETPYKTERVIAEELEFLILGHLDTLLEAVHRNASSEQRAQALTPITEFVANISKIITERLTEMEIKINGRKRKIIRKDTPELSRLAERPDTGLGESAGSSERSIDSRDIREVRDVILSTSRVDPSVLRAGAVLRAPEDL